MDEDSPIFSDATTGRYPSHEHNSGDHTNVPTTTPVAEPHSPGNGMIGLQASEAIAASPPPCSGQISDVEPCWTQPEDDLLLHLRSTAGLPWRSIVRYFPHLHGAALRHRFESLVTSGPVKESTQLGCERNCLRKRKATPCLAAEHTNKPTGPKRRRGRPRKVKAITAPDAGCATRKTTPSKPTWTVDRILGYVYKDGKQYYQVRWEDTLEPVENLRGCADTAIAEFHLRHLL